MDWHNKVISGPKLFQRATLSSDREGRLRSFRRLGPAFIPGSNGGEVLLSSVHGPCPFGFSQFGSEAQATEKPHRIGLTA